jgi:hypothetical protein
LTGLSVSRDGQKEKTEESNGKKNSEDNGNYGRYGTGENPKKGAILCPGMDIQSRRRLR